MASRVDLFREYIERLDPSSLARRANGDDFYVDPPGRPVGDQLAARLQLAPSSAHLVVGSVGSGKTTQLRRTLELLAATEDTKAVYIDVSKGHDLDKRLAGVLIVLAGLQLSRLVKANDDSDVKESREKFRRWAHGHRVFVPYYDGPPDEYDEPDWEEGEPGRYVERPGKLSPPMPPLRSETKESIEALKVLKSALPKKTRHFVVLFDSLDRVSDVDQFRSLAVEDVRALHEAGIGIVVVGPGRLVYGLNRPTVDLFDQMHSVPALDVEGDKVSREFLKGVLQKRATDELIPSQMRRKLVHWSGGIIRDLLGLARSAVEEAFVSGADVVTEEHVSRAADQFGRSMMLGLRKAEVASLQRLREKGTFVPTTDEDLALLESRRVLEYHGVPNHYAVHPTIEPLLAALKG